MYTVKYEWRQLVDYRWALYSITECGPLVVVAPERIATVRRVLKKNRPVEFWSAYAKTAGKIVPCSIAFKTAQDAMNYVDTLRRLNS